jgi:undecaprenyl-diphosphatase
MTDVGLAAESPPAIPGVHDRPPGERYYRHPGDVVRLAVWGITLVVLLLFVEVATGTSDGLRTDLGGAATAPPLAFRQLLLACVQVTSLVVPAGVVAVLVATRHWRRLVTVVLAAAAGAGAMVLVAAVLDDPDPIAGAIGTDGWLFASDFPSLVYVSAAVAATIVGKPWLSRRWRRFADVATVALVVTIAVAGGQGAPELVLAVAAGSLAGSVVLVAVGAPNRRPTSAMIAEALARAGLSVRALQVERAAGGRAQLYRLTTSDGSRFLKVYGNDTRDADLLYRSYRSLVLRDPHGAGAATASVRHEAEHEALLLVLASRGGVACPTMHAVVALPDSSMVLVTDDVDGRRLEDLEPDELDDDLLDEVWSQVAVLHRAGLAHGSLRRANILVTTGPDGERGVAIIDLSAATAASSRRDQAIDRAELIASLAATAGPEAVVDAAARVLDTDDLAAAMPYLQPLALSAGTRRTVSKSTLRAARDHIAAVTGHEPVPLERLVRVKPKTVVTIAALTGAFYVLLPQLANVDESVEALGSANWAWLAGAAVLSMLTYVMAAIGLMGGVREDLPLVATTEVALASSFVNRVTPANVGGMALNVRYMQKAGVPPAEAVTGVGLNVLAGGVVHIGLLVVFFAWAGRGASTGFSIPSSSTLLVAIAVVLALLGIALATRRGRRLVWAHVLPPIRQSLRSIVTLARSPSRITALFGGSVGVTMAYIGALACAVAAFDGGVSFAQVGAVYLGASMIAAAAPTPGGLGAMEAALVAGLTGVGMDPAIAVAAVLSYRLVTFWLPILPGWLSFRLLEGRNYI